MIKIATATKSYILWDLFSAEVRVVVLLNLYRGLSCKGYLLGFDGGILV